MPSEPAGHEIPLCVPEVRGREWVYVKECLDSGWVSSVGSYVDRFEREMAQCVGTAHAVATVNGTAALHTALLVAGVMPDDEVLVSTLTFIAPVNAIRYAGAWPVLIDAEPVHAQMDPALVAQFLERDCVVTQGVLRNRATGRRIHAIVPVHILGHPCDLKPLLALARRYGLAVVEDATESLGAEYFDGEVWRGVGSLGDLSCFSFNGNKLITTGGGGMICTDNPQWAARAKYLTTQAKDDPIEYVHHEIGFNYRLTNIQAAMGCAQLEQLPAFVAKKRAIQTAYAAGLADLPGLRLLGSAAWAQSACWMPTAVIDARVFGCGSRALLQRLQACGIQTRPLWTPAHLNRPHAASPRVGGAMAERFHANALSLPCSVGLTTEDQQRVIAAIREASQ